MEYSLYTRDFKKWCDKVDALPEEGTTASEKLLARHLQQKIDWFGEQPDCELWGARVRVSYRPMTRATGMSPQKIGRLLREWNEAGIVDKKEEQYKDQIGGWHTRVYLEVTRKFLDGDIVTGIYRKKERGVKKGSKIKMCPCCGKRLGKRVFWECENGHVHWSLTHIHGAPITHDPFEDDRDPFEPEPEPEEKEEI